MKDRKSLLILVIVLLVACSIAVVTSIAESADISMGGGIGLAPDYEGSDDYELVPIPFVNVKWENGMFVNLEYRTIRANLIPSDFWRLGLMANYRPKRSNVENDQVDRLGNVGPALEVGPFAGIQYKNWNVSVEVTTDVAEGHDGTLFTARSGYHWVTSDNLTILFGASTTYASNDYMASYFSIDLRESLNSGLPEYHADSGFKDINFSLKFVYGITDRWSARGIASYTRLVGDAEDSPVVDDVGNANQFFSGLIIVYNFGGQ
jgi:outer membrane protein